MLRECESMEGTKWGHAVVNVFPSGQVDRFGKDRVRMRLRNIGAVRRA